MSDHTQTQWQVEGPLGGGGGTAGSSSSPVDGASLELLLHINVLTVIVHHNYLKMVVLCSCVDLKRGAMVD